MHTRERKRERKRGQEERLNHLKDNPNIWSEGPSQGGESEVPGCLMVQHREAGVKRD